MVIPHFDHVKQFRRFLPALTQLKVPMLVVDDASPDHAFEELQRLLWEAAPGTILIRHAVNRGKGGAVKTALKAAQQAGFTHAMQVDADGQHEATGLESILLAASQHESRIICGLPVFDEKISKLRYYARYLTTFLCWLETLSKEIQDPMCGLRVYPLQSTLPLIEGGQLGDRMDFDPEILVRAVWKGTRLHYVPIQVSYPAYGRSHFRYLRDNLLISWMHTRLVFGMLRRLPTLVRQTFSKATRHGTHGDY
jgi:glycosyltransferase involved in cell wall biosynthesis